MLVLVNWRWCYLMKQSSDFFILPDYIFLPFCPLGSFFIYHSISHLKIHFVNIYNSMTFYFLRIYNSFWFILALCVWMSVCMCLRKPEALDPPGAGVSGTGKSPTGAGRAVTLSLKLSYCRDILPVLLCWVLLRVFVTIFPHEFLISFSLSFYFIYIPLISNIELHSVLIYNLRTIIP